MWICVDNLPSAPDDCIVVVLLKQTNNGFGGSPTPLSHRIKIANYSPTKKVFSFDGIFNANHLITHYMLLQRDPYDHC